MTRRTGDRNRRGHDAAPSWRTETTVESGVRIDHPTGAAPTVRPHVEARTTARLRAPSDSTGIRTTPTASLTAGTSEGGHRIEAGGGMEVEIPLGETRRDQHGHLRSELDAVVRGEGHVNVTATGGRVDVGGGIDVGAGIRGHLSRDSDVTITGGPFIKTDVGAQGGTTFGVAAGVEFKPTAESTDED